MRILITGSRDWTNEKIIEDALRAHSEGKDVTLVSGACPTGADKIGENIAQFFLWSIERYPADWDRYGRRAGFVRNNEMVKSDPDICLAFIKNTSRGATLTAKLAEKRGIKVVRYYP